MRAAHVYEKIRRSLLWIAILALIIVAGYMLYSGKSPHEIARTTAGEASAIDK
jgi:hypothetical protein